MASELVENGMLVSAINKATGNGHNGDRAVCLTTVDYWAFQHGYECDLDQQAFKGNFLLRVQWVWRICQQARSIFSRAKGRKHRKQSAYKSQPETETLTI